MYRFISETYNYNYIKIGGVLPFTAAIWAILGGFAAGLILSYHNKSYLGETVRRLCEKGATTPESALTLDELGLKPTFMRTRALREGGSLRKYVEIANRDEALTPLEQKKRPKIISFLFPQREKYEHDFSRAKFYIPEEKKYAAEARYEHKASLSPLLLVISLAAIAAIGVAASFAAPKILKLIDDSLTSVFQSNS